MWISCMHGETVADGTYSIATSAAPEAIVAILAWV